MLHCSWSTVLFIIVCSNVVSGAAKSTRREDLGSCASSIPEPLEPVLERIMTAGGQVRGDSGIPAGMKPPWLDIEKFRRGQAFAQRYLYGVLVSEFHALYLTYALPSLLDPMVFTGRSDTPDEAYERYLDTVDRVVSWYYGDVFDDMSPAFQNMVIVRALHNDVRAQMNGLSAGELRNRTQVPGYMACPHQRKMRVELESICPYGHQVDFTEYNREWISQRDMAITQWAFLGLLAVHPKAYGVSDAKPEDMDDFVYVWEVLGFLLGIKDEFNICQGGFEVVRRRSEQLLKYFLLPSLRVITPKWEHMAKCMAEGIGYFGPGTDFETGMEVMLNDVLHLNASSITNSLNPIQRAAVAQYRATLSVLRRAPGAWKPASAFMYGAFQSAKRLPRDVVKRLVNRRNARREDCYENQNENNNTV